MPAAEAIFAAQRVRKQFQTVIQTSPSVQNNPRDSSTDTWKLVTMSANQGFAFFTKLDVYVEGAMNDAPTTATQFARSLATPVSLNSCLLLVHAGNPSAAAFSGRWNRMDPHGFATVLPGWSGHQHGNSYFADAPCLEVDVSLRIALGPDTLRVSTTVEQDTALTIKDAISGALIAQSCLELYHDEEEQLYTTVYGVPAEIISEMECGLECEAVLDLAECQSGLLGLTSPTDRERADVEKLPKMIKFHRSIRRLSGQRRSTPLSRGAMPTWHFVPRNM